MAYGKKIGTRAVFWIVFILLGILVFVALFYWMIAKPKTIPHSPAQAGFFVTTSPNPSCASASLLTQTDA